MGSGNRYTLHAWIHAAVSERRYMGERAPDWGKILCQHILIHLSRWEFCFALTMSTPDAYLGTLHSLKQGPAIQRITSLLCGELFTRAQRTTLGNVHGNAKWQAYKDAERALQELDQHAIDIRCRCPMACCVVTSFPYNDASQSVTQQHARRSDSIDGPLQQDSQNRG